MKAKQLALSTLLLLGCGCSTTSNTGAGAVAGGVLGGVAGTVVGAAVGRPLAGAAIGAAAGAGTGALVGNAEDHREQRAAAAYAANHPPLTITDVVGMVQNHISDAVIIQQMRETGSTYNLTPSDVIWLKQQGVSDAVVMEMQARRPGTVYGQPVYVVPADPPPVAVGVGVGWYGGRRCWR
jgi:hypothetical protein